MQSSLIFSLVGEFLASPFVRISVSLEPGLVSRFVAEDVEGFFFRVAPLTWARVVRFFRATIRGLLPSLRVRRIICLRGLRTPDFDLALCA